MRSIGFAGHDFSPYTTAEVFLPAAHGMVPEAREVPGRPGALLLGGSIPPKRMRARLFLDLEDDADAEDLAGIRHEMASWLASDEGAELTLPGEPGLTYRDVLCTDFSEWDCLFEDGSCELEFTAFDPVAWGELKAYQYVPQGSDPLGLPVGGTYRTAPTFEFTAAAGDSVKVACGDGYVEVERTFAGGEDVVVDCEARSVTVDGEDARADVTLGSDLSLWAEPGFSLFSAEGFDEWYVVMFTERWL